METTQSPITASAPTLPFKLAAIDLDDPLLGADKSVSPSNLAAIKRLQGAKVQVIIASGRFHDDCLAYHDMLEIDGPIISCQGALILHPKTGHVLHKRTLNEDLSRYIFQQGENFGATVVFYSENGVCSNQYNEWTVLYEQATGRKMHQADPSDFLKIGLPYKIQWLHVPEQIQNIYARIAAEISQDTELSTYNHFAGVLEFLPLGVSKGEAIAKVAEDYGVRRQEVLCFGDAHNDISMLSWAGLGVAMDHAHAEVKATAAFSAPDGELETALPRAIDIVFDRYQEFQPT